MGLDVTKHEAALRLEDEGRVVHLMGPHGPIMDGDVPVTITVAGSYSRHFRDQQNRQRDRMLRQRRLKVTSDLVNDADLELQAACVLGWQGIEQDGKPLPCTFENAKMLLRALPDVREQVVEAMYDHEGFTRTSSQT